MALPVALFLGAQWLVSPIPTWLAVRSAARDGWNCALAGDGSGPAEQALDLERLDRTDLAQVWAVAAEPGPMLWVSAPGLPWWPDPQGHN
jgi:hypothetical protein